MTLSRYESSNDLGIACDNESNSDAQYKKAGNAVARPVVEFYTSEQVTMEDGVLEEPGTKTYREGQAE
ncbi:hypothetical protein ACRB8A_19875 (plasmid) [Arthrobacter sp. G.S.26]|uniref:hypothetical protein n=1 Tax=Arthrobacter sp. G.S.26 TaxID=3433706 RepID=UPI003D78814E